METGREPFIPTKKKVSKSRAHLPHQTVMVYGIIIKRAKGAAKKRGMPLVQFVDQALRYAMSNM